MQIEGAKKHVITAGVIDLILDEGENNLIISDALPMYDEVGMIQDAFTFRIINNSPNPANYTLKLNNTTTKEISSGKKCSELGEITIDSPESCRTITYPSSLRTEALNFCSNDFDETFATEAECLETLSNSGYPFPSFEVFSDDLIMNNIIEDTRNLQTHPDNDIMVAFPSLNEKDVKYGLTKDGKATIGNLSKYSDGLHEMVFREFCSYFEGGVDTEEECLVEYQKMGEHFYNFDQIIEEYIKIGFLDSEIKTH